MEVEFGRDDGAPDRTRTCGTRFRKPLLYPLSYRGLKRDFPSTILFDMCERSDRELAA